MKFFKALSFAALVAAVSANTVEMVSRDNFGRTIKFTPQEGSPELPDLRLEPGETVIAEFPDHWIGNWIGVRDGQESDGNGMLGEIRWNGWGGLNYFDVSAIVAPDDTNNVKLMYPKNAKSPTSGCEQFPCDNCYNNWDDIQTKSTPESEIVCLFGDVGQTEIGRRSHPREFLTRMRS